MLRASFIGILIGAASFLYAQPFTFRGAIKDEQTFSLPNVRILQRSTGMIFRSSGEGTFAISSNTAVDSFFFFADGFLPSAASWNPAEFLQITLKRQPIVGTSQTLSSLTLGWNRQQARHWLTGNETYANLLENRFVSASDYSSTGLSLSIDRASYSNIRRFIRQRTRVPVDAVRIEELLNYFNLDYKLPDPGKSFRVQTKLTNCPWNESNRLFFVQASAKQLNLDTLPPAHFTFLIDVSASMDAPNRLPLLQSAFRMLVENLRDKDSVAIVTYGGVTGVLLQTTSGSNKDTIRRVIDSLVAGGATPGESGVRLAYSVAKRHFIPGGNNRVILATDGDFNVGMKTEEELEQLIARESERGIYLTCLGVGMGNYKDSKIQLLAKRGNGNFAYLDGFQEAEKVLFREFAQTLYSVADDAAMYAEFNPKRVAEYRLIGFDNKYGAMRDTAIGLQGGEVGTGQSAIAIFELRLNEGASTEEALARVKLNYRMPSDSTRRQEEEWVQPMEQQLNALDSAYRFAACLAWFGSLLRASTYVPARSWDGLLDFTALAVSKSDPDQVEFEQLVEAAYRIYHPKKKWPRNKRKKK